MPTDNVNTSSTNSNSDRESVIRVRSQVLYGWLDSNEALSMLSRVDDSEEEIVRVTQLHERMVRNVRTRTAYRTQTPIIAHNTAWNLNEISQRPELGVLMTAGVKVVLVDLRKILAFQKTVRVPGLNDRVSASTNLDEIKDLCIPANDPPTPYTLTFDSDGQALTLSSFNPNFQASGPNIGRASVQTNPDVPPVEIPQAVIIQFGAPTSFVQVAKFRGRYFLRDGYHRAVSLLRAGVYKVPCLLSEANTLREVYSAAGNFLNEEIIMGSRPPLLADFINETVSGEGETMEVRKLIRIRSDQFMVYS